MAEGYTGEIRLFAGNFAPQNWHFCDGTLLNVRDYPPLFALIGVTYGGDGQTTFALPDLRGRLPMDQGAQTPVTSPRPIGQKGGQTAVTLSQDQILGHNHALSATGATANSCQPEAQSFLAAAAPGDVFYLPFSTEAPMAQLNDQTISASGLPTPSSHDNIMPCMGLNFIICLVGIFPQQSQ